jgi:HSP20 family protein
MRALVPERGLAGIRREVDRLFERLWEPDGLEVTMAGDWIPKLEVSEAKDAVTARVEVPGIEPKDIQVALEGQLLTIKGEKKQAQEEKDRDERYYRMERAYGAFARTIRLPAPVDPKKVKATFKNGVLTVTMPKAPVESGNLIPVTIE